MRKRKMTEQKSPGRKKQNELNEAREAAAKANEIAAMTAASIVGKRRLTPPPQT
jgi:hypothetical protein